MRHRHPEEGTEDTTPLAAPIAARAPWEEVIFVCRKCMRKEKGRDDIGGRSLSKWLRKALKHSAPGRFRVVETACFDLCPKKGVTLALGSELSSGVKPLRVLRRRDPATRVLAWLGRTDAAGLSPTGRKDGRVQRS